jgi:endonuclease IV
MKVGIKIFPDRINQIESLAKIADFIEIMASNDLIPEALKGFPIPITIHAQHYTLGINPADKSLNDINLKAVKKAQEAADIINSDIIILHSGILLNKNCSLENAINFFKKINDPRIIFENLGDYNALCRTPEEVRYFKEETGSDFCLDFAHATIISSNFNSDYKKFVTDLSKLKPVYFHISDGIVGAEKDTHQNLGKGNFDIRFFRRFIKDKRVALEVEPSSSLEAYKKQIDFLKQ